MPPLLLNFVMSTLILLFVNVAHANNNLKGLKQELNDSVITTKITAKFTKDKNLNPLKISVSTKNGIVTLQGHVKNKQAFVDALKLAKNTKGVRSLNANNLIIKEVNTSFTDTYITTKVEAAILKAKVFEDESIPLVGINASTKNGTVFLSGNVKNQKSITVILKRVAHVQGVKHVISKLKIRKSKNHK